MMFYANVYIRGGNSHLKKAYQRAALQVSDVNSENEVFLLFHVEFIKLYVCFCSQIFLTLKTTFTWKRMLGFT